MNLLPISLGDTKSVKIFVISLLDVMSNTFPQIYQQIHARSYVEQSKLAANGDAEQNRRQ